MVRGWRDGDIKVRNPGEGAHGAEGKDESRFVSSCLTCKMPALKALSEPHFDESCRGFLHTVKSYTSYTLVKVENSHSS